MADPIDWTEYFDEFPELVDEDGDFYLQFVVNQYRFEVGDMSVQVWDLRHPTLGEITFTQGDEPVGGSTGLSFAAGRFSQKVVKADWAQAMADPDDED